MTEQTPTLTFQELDSILQIIDSAPRDGEVKITIGDVTLEVATRSSSPAPAPAPAPQPAAVAVPAPAPASAAAPARSADTPAAAQAPVVTPPAATVVDDSDVAGFIAVPAPMTGVFYSKPNPAAEPFVAVGDTVVKGQDLAIVEVMKLMNRIGSPVDGVVRRICAENESLVEHGNALFYIEATGGAA